MPWLHCTICGPNGMTTDEGQWMIDEGRRMIDEGRRMESLRFVFQYELRKKEFLLICYSLLV
jgi:NAD(P)H-flavin reductase